MPPRAAAHSDGHLPRLPVERTRTDAHNLGQQVSGGEEETMHSLRVATGMTGLLVVTTILFLAQFIAGPVPVMP
jgi:hypothetical protein